VRKSGDGDLTDAEPPPDGDGSPPVRGGWDLAGQLIDRIASGTWTWGKTWQLAVLVVVLAAALAMLAWAGHGWPAWTAASACGAAGGVAALHHRKPPRK
jgi:hypothetical protein